MNHKTNFSKTDRKGVTVILFAILLPVLLLLAMIAINIAHMQLTRTELKIATDASARAGGRAWSEFNDLARAKEFARQAAELNTVSGSPLILSTDESAGEMFFGHSIRHSNARYAFTPIPDSEIADGELVSGFQVNATHDTPLLFAINGLSSFTPNASSIVTQVERDIALILDRSGSMFFFEGQVTNPGQGEELLFDKLTAVFNDPASGLTQGQYQRAVSPSKKLLTSTFGVKDREYSPEILDLLSGDLKEYASSVNTDYRTGISAPKFSRWYSLEIAYEAFFDVLEATDQIEWVAVSSFGSDARLDVPLTSNLDAARSLAADIIPSGSTAIGDGLLEGFDSLNGPNARVGAIKTLIVLSDGENRKGVKPVDAAKQIMAENPATVINTVTFGAGADVTEMQEVASIGAGKHFHAENAAQLVEVFRILAGTNRTLITQ